MRLSAAEIETIRGEIHRLDRAELDPEGTLLDVVNRVEKRGLLAHAGRSLTRIQPVAVERGTPSPVAISMFPVRRTSSRSRWS